MYNSDLLDSAHHSLGNVYQRMGKLDDAFRLHSLSLSVRQDVLGETYRTAGSSHKVAWHLYLREDYAGSEYIYPLLH